MHDHQFYIDHLKLEPHPEGGYYIETYRSGDVTGQLPERFAGERNISTAIYYLLKGNQFSAFHKLKSDEIWHFYDGCSLKLYIIDPSGKLLIRKLGKNPDQGEFPQLLIPHDNWFAAKPFDSSGYTLAGCTVAPGFEFGDFVMGERKTLLQLFPQHSELILEFTQ